MTAAIGTASNGITVRISTAQQIHTNSDTALTDTLDNTPVSDASVMFFNNGILQTQGVGKDYTVSGTTITVLASSGTASNMKATDDLVAYYAE